MSEEEEETQLAILDFTEAQERVFEDALSEIKKDKIHVDVFTSPSDITRILTGSVLDKTTLKREEDTKNIKVHICDLLTHCQVPFLRIITVWDKKTDTPIRIRGHLQTCPQAIALMDFLGFSIHENLSYILTSDTYTRHIYSFGSHCCVKCEQ